MGVGAEGHEILMGGQKLGSIAKIAILRQVGPLIPAERRRGQPMPLDVRNVPHAPDTPKGILVDIAIDPPPLGFQEEKRQVAQHGQVRRRLAKVGAQVGPHGIVDAHVVGHNLTFLKGQRLVHQLFGG